MVLVLLSAQPLSRGFSYLNSSCLMRAAAKCSTAGCGHLRLKEGPWLPGRLSFPFFSCIAFVETVRQKGSFRLPTSHCSSQRFSSQRPRAARRAPGPSRPSPAALGAVALVLRPRPAQPSRACGDCGAWILVIARVEFLPPSMARSQQSTQRSITHVPLCSFGDDEPLSPRGSRLLR